MATRPMRIRASAKGDVVSVRVLMSHIMETGQRKDSSGNLVPAHYIKEVEAKCNDKVVLKAHWGPAVARDPYLSFQFKGGQKGDKLTITWTDNKGESRTDETTIS